MPVSAVTNWPELDVRCTLAIGRVTGNYHTVKLAREIAFDLGVNAVFKQGLDDLVLPGQLIDGCAELFIEWCRGVTYVWSIHLKRELMIKGALKCDECLCDHTCAADSELSQRASDSARKKMEHWLAVQSRLPISLPKLIEELVSARPYEPGFPKVDG